MIRKDDNREKMIKEQAEKANQMKIIKENQPPQPNERKQGVKIFEVKLEKL